MPNDKVILNDGSSDETQPVDILEVPTPMEEPAPLPEAVPVKVQRAQYQNKPPGSSTKMMAPDGEEVINVNFTESEAEEAGWSRLVLAAALVYS